MTSRTAWLCAVVGVALARAAPSEAAGEAPRGEIWVVMSPAACPGAGGVLIDYERSIQTQLDAAMTRLGAQARRFQTRAALLDALHNQPPSGWLLLFFSGHGTADGGPSRVCIGDRDHRGEWLDINRELLPALPASLGGAVIVLDNCSSAHVDPRIARVPTAIVSASPYQIDTGALFGATLLATLAAARDDNCNGVFDDDDLFAGLNHRLQASLTLTSFEAWPKLRRNAPSAVPLPVRAQPSPRCAALWATATAVPEAALPRPLAAQRQVQAALAGGQLVLPRLDRDFFVIADGADAADARTARDAAVKAGLIELIGVDAAHAAALAATTSFAEIYRLDPALGWLQTWRLRDGLLVGVARLAKARCGMPSRAMASDIEYYVPNVKPRYERADRYLREVAGAVHAPHACFESEGQCFDAPVERKQAKECEP